MGRIELSPVRAGMVDHPGAYRWSSYRYNAQGEADELITPHGVFTALDADRKRSLCCPTRERTQPPRHAGQGWAPAEKVGRAGEPGLVRVGVVAAQQGKARRA